MNCKTSVIVGVLASVLFVVACAAVLILRQQETIVEMPPWAFTALAAPSGDADARSDLANGVRQVRLAIMTLSEAEEAKLKLGSFGYTSLDPGCVVDDDEAIYWIAYNRVMVEAGRQQYGERFTVALKGNGHG